MVNTATKPYARLNALYPLAVALALLLGLAARVVWLRDVGYVDDIEGFAVPWLRTAAHAGAAEVYDRYSIVYPPASVYLLGLIGRLSGGPAAPGAITPAELFFLKLTSIAFDLFLVALLGRLGRAVAGPRVGLAGALLFALCPPFVLISGWWGQIDSWYIFFMFVAVWAVARGRPLLGWGVLGVALAFKVQTAVLLPLFGLVTWRQDGIRRLILGVALLAAVWLAFTAPVLLVDPDTPLLTRISETARDFPYVNAGGHNLWYALTPVGRGRGLDAYSDLQATPLGVSYRDVGLGLLAAGYGALLAVLFVRRDRRLVFAGAALAWLLFFMLPTRIHARFLLPALPFLLAAGFYWRRWWWLYGAYSLTLFVNLLERAGPLSPLAVWFTVTPALSLLNAWLNVGLFVVAWLWLWRAPAAEPSTGRGHARAWRDLVRWERALLGAGTAALAVGIALVWARGYTVGQAVAAWSASLPATLAEQLAAADPAQTVIVNWPRQVAAEARLFGIVPVTPPATFLPRPDEIAPQATWRQYTPWQAAGPWAMTYHGDQATEAELRAAAAAAQWVLLFDAAEPGIAPMAAWLPDTPGAPCLAAFADGVCLLEAKVQATNPARWRLSLVWHVVAPPGDAPTVFVHGLDRDGQLLTQADGWPAAGLLPFDQAARPEQVLRETRFLSPGDGLAHVLVGLYDPASGQRLAVQCAPGVACLPDAVEIAPTVAP